MAERETFQPQRSGPAAFGKDHQIQTAEPGSGGRAKNHESLPVLNSRLMCWLSPAFPIGAYAYSHGLEKAVESLLISNSESLEAWLTDLCLKGSLNNDLVILSWISRAVSENDRNRVGEVSELASALAPSGERHLEAHALGSAFITAIMTGWPDPDFEEWLRVVELPVAYPVAVGLATSVHGMGNKLVLSAYATSFISNLLSSAIRLGVIGQSKSQIIQAHIESVIDTQTDSLLVATPDQLGGGCFVSDLCSLQHETQNVRLFRT